MKIHVKQLICTICNRMPFFIHTHTYIPHIQYGCFTFYCSILIRELYITETAINPKNKNPNSGINEQNIQQCIKKRGRYHPLFLQHYLLSTIKVTGPSLIKETSIIAPNFPVSTCNPCLRTSSLKKSYKRSA